MLGRESGNVCQWKAQALSYLGHCQSHNAIFPVPSVSSQVVGMMQKISTFSGDSTQKGEVLFGQWAFEVRSVMQSHRGNIAEGHSTIFMQSHH